jgi:hypothetical protein
MDTKHARSRRDSRVADEHAAESAHESKLMCQAHGCPNRWSVDAGKGPLCSAHAWVPTSAWPQVTQEQLDAQAMRAAYPPAAPTPVRRDLHQLRAELAKLASARPVEGRDIGWAKRILERAGGGDQHMTDTQVTMARAAIREHLQASAS